MRKKGSGESTLDMEFASPLDTVTRDLSTVSELIALQLAQQSTEWDRILEEQIRMGWGDTPQKLIPEDWRTRFGPERKITAKHKKAISRGRKAAHRAKKDIAGSNLRPQNTEVGL